MYVTRMNLHLVPGDDFDPLENTKAWRRLEDNLLVLPETMKQKSQRRQQEYCRSDDNIGFLCTR